MEIIIFIVVVLVIKLVIQAKYDSLGEQLKQVPNDFASLPPPLPDHLHSGQLDAKNDNSRKYSDELWEDENRRFYETNESPEYPQ